MTAALLTAGELLPHECGEPRPTMYGARKCEMKAARSHRTRDIVLHVTPAGQCRICLCAILRPNGERSRQATWHPGCVVRYDFAVGNHQGIRRAVYDRDHGVCAGCGTPDDNPFGGWEADHIVPLIEGGEIDLDNLQTLCHGCHAAKTRREAGERTERRRDARRDRGSELQLGETA